MRFGFGLRDALLNNQRRDAQMAPRGRLPPNKKQAKKSSSSSSSSYVCAPPPAQLQIYLRFLLTGCSFLLSVTLQQSNKTFAPRICFAQSRRGRGTPSTFGSTKHNFNGLLKFTIAKSHQLEKYKHFVSCLQLGFNLSSGAERKLNVPQIYCSEKRCQD